LISAPGGRFSVGTASILVTAFLRGFQLGAPVASLSVQKTFAVPTGVATLRFNQENSLYK